MLAVYFCYSGRVCVPIDTRKLDEFDPFTVPTIRYVGFISKYSSPYYQIVSNIVLLMCGDRQNTTDFVRFVIAHSHQDMNSGIFGVSFP